LAIRVAVRSSLQPLLELKEEPAMLGLLRDVYIDPIKSSRYDSPSCRQKPRIV
jgi:hypothetical protein